MVMCVITFSINIMQSIYISATLPHWAKNFKYFKHNCWKYSIFFKFVLIKSPTIVLLFFLCFTNHPYFNGIFFCSVLKKCSLFLISTLTATLSLMKGGNFSFLSLPLIYIKMKSRLQVQHLFKQKQDFSFPVHNVIRST